MPRLVGATQTVTTQAEQITTFNSSGTFTAQPLTSNAWVLVVAGGGGGAQQGSGGGAGGYIEVPSHPLPSGSFPITVGGGGTGGPNPALPPGEAGRPGGAGSNSILGAAAPLSAIGGGEGVRGISGGPLAGGSGGSGGGGTGQINFNRDKK
jgi:hypothetical protein